MTISIIIPAYNASATLGKTLDSVLAQTDPHWEAIVVNDGSSDSTADLARSYAARDSRIRVASQRNQGESAARNKGVGKSASEWLAFLDADDWIAPTYVEVLSAALTRNPALDAVHCGYVRVTADGMEIADDYRAPDGNLFPVLARRAAFAVHACVVKKSVVEAVGRFDVSLKTCPDWDLWQRVARAGARFGSVPENLAYYRMTPHSASLNAEQLFRDGLRVLRTGHAPDPRVLNPCPEFANGLHGSTVESQEFYLLSWNAGIMLGSGRDPRPLLKLVGGDSNPALYPDAIARCLFQSVTLPSAQPSQAWEDLWPRLSKRTERFLIALETQSKTQNLASQALTELKKLVLKSSATWGPVIERNEETVAGLRNENARLSELPGREQWDKAEREKGVLEVQLSESRKTSDSLVLANASLASESGEIRGRLAIAAGREAELAAILDQVHARVWTLSEENASTRRQIEELGDAAASQRKAVSELRFSLEAANTRVQVAESEKAAIECHVEALRGKLAVVSDESFTLKSALDDARSGIAKLETESGEARATAQALENGKLQAESQLEQSRGEVSAGRSRLAEMALELDQAHSRNQLIEEEKAALVIANAVKDEEWRAKAAGLAQESSRLATKLESATLQNDEHERQNILLASQLSDAANAANVLEQRQAELMHRLELAALQNDRHERQNALLAGQLSDALNATSVLEQRRAELMRKLEKADAKIRELEIRSDFMDSEVERLREETVRLEQENAVLTTELEKWRTSCDVRARLIEEIQQERWVRLGRKLGALKTREVAPATLESSFQSVADAAHKIGNEESPKWEFRAGEGNEAHVIYPRHDHAMVSVGITKAGTRNEWDIQLNHPGVPVHAGERWVVTFRARAERPRQIAAGFAKAHEPWTSLGFHARLSLTQEWQTFREEFTAPEDDGKTRIHFDLGGSDAGVDITTVTLEKMESGLDRPRSTNIENSLAQGHPA